jgi:hypothetical protein
VSFEIAFQLAVAAHAAAARFGHASQFFDGATPQNGNRGEDRIFGHAETAADNFTGASGATAAGGGNTHRWDLAK